MRWRAEGQQRRTFVRESGEVVQQAATAACHSLGPDEFVDDAGANHPVHDIVRHRFSDAQTQRPTAAAVSGPADAHLVAHLPGQEQQVRWDEGRAQRLDARLPAVRGRSTATR